MRPISKWLDKKTNEFVYDYEMKWGAGRKALNLFLRDCLYNRYLSAEHGLDCIQKWVEIPLDSIVADRLKKDAGRRGRLPVWNGLSNLKKDDSKNFRIMHVS